MLCTYLISTESYPTYTVVPVLLVDCFQGCAPPHPNRNNPHTLFLIHVVQLAVGLITHIRKVETRLHRPWSFLRLFNFHCLTYIRTRRISTQSLREDAAVTALRLGSGTIILYTCLNVRPRRAVPDSRAPLFFADTET